MVSHLAHSTDSLRETADLTLAGHEGGLVLQTGGGIVACGGSR